jgi:NAD(P)-dependent dehydrogenase (short-subunit alcohol dehydrogenase family)
VSSSSNNTLITGADRGIGLGLVRHYLEKGESIVATSRRTEPSDELAALTETYPERIRLVSLDVADEESISRFGDDIRDIGITFATVISNAGVTVAEDFGAWTAKTFSTNFRVNTVGPALLVQAIESSLEGGAKVVQISSGMGSAERNINPDNPLDAYAVSKCGLNILSRRLAEKLRSRGVIVVSLDPGWVKTDMGGPEAPTEVGDAVRRMTSTIEQVTIDDTGNFLSSDGSRIPW